MQRIITFIYIIVTGVIATVTTILEIQPALFLINIFAPHEGDKYSPVLVMFLLWIVLISPIIIFLIIARLIRSGVDENIEPGRTGIIVTRLKSFQSALVGIPVYINDKKAGTVDNGRTKFFDTAVDMLTVQAGNGRQASEKLLARIEEGKQLRFEIIIKQAGLHLKIVLRQL